MNGVFERFIAAKKAHADTFGRIILVPADRHSCCVHECSKEEWDALEVASLKEKAARSTLMPTEQDALNLMHDCYERLKELGWREAIYCPKDGTEFDAIEAGSTGVHRCHYAGEWPTGHWWVADHGDLWPARPILFRIPDAEEEP